MGRRTPRPATETSSCGLHRLRRQYHRFSRRRHCANRNRPLPNLQRPPLEALVCGRNLRLNYVELHARSAFSFLEGASLPEDLVGRAKELEYPAIALLDRDGVYGSPRFHMAAKTAGLRAHVGAEISVEGFGNRASRPSWMPGTSAPRPVRLALLVENRAGYRNLCRLITRYKLRETEKGAGTATLDEVAEFA